MFGRIDMVTEEEIVHSQMVIDRHYADGKMDYAEWNKLTLAIDSVAEAKRFNFIRLEKMYNEMTKDNVIH